MLRSLKFILGYFDNRSMKKVLAVSYTRSLISLRSVLAPEVVDSVLSVLKVNIFDLPATCPQQQVPLSGDTPWEARVKSNEPLSILFPLFENGQILNTWETDRLPPEKKVGILAALQAMEAFFLSPQAIDVALVRLNNQFATCLSEKDIDIPLFDPRGTFSTLILPIPSESHRLSDTDHATFLQDTLEIMTSMLKDVGVETLWLFSGYINSQKANQVVQKGQLFIEGIDSISPAHGIWPHIFQWLLILNNPDIQSVMKAHDIGTTDLIAAFVQIVSQESSKVTLWSVYIDIFMETIESQQMKSPLMSPFILNRVLMEQTDRYPLLSKFTFTSYALALSEIQKRMQWISTSQLVEYLIESKNSFGMESLYNLQKVSEGISIFTPQAHLLYPNKAGMFKVEAASKDQPAPPMVEKGPIVPERSLFSPDGHTLTSRLMQSLPTHPELLPEISLLISEGFLPMTPDQSNPYVHTLGVRNLSLKGQLQLLKAIYTYQNSVEPPLHTSYLTGLISEKITLMGELLHKRENLTDFTEYALIYFLIDKGFLPMSESYPNPYHFVITKVNAQVDTKVSILNAIYEYQAQAHQLQDPILGIHYRYKHDENSSLSAIVLKKMKKQPPDVIHKLARFFTQKGVLPVSDAMPHELKYIDHYAGSLSDDQKNELKRPAAG